MPQDRHGLMKSDAKVDMMSHQKRTSFLQLVLRDQTSFTAPNAKSNRRAESFTNWTFIHFWSLHDRPLLSLSSTHPSFRDTEYFMENSSKNSGIVGFYFCLFYAFCHLLLVSGNGLNEILLEGRIGRSTPRPLQWLVLDNVINVPRNYLISHLWIIFCLVCVCVV